MNSILASIHNYLAHHKEEYLSIFGFIAGLMSFLDKITPILQFLLLFLSCFSLFISIILKIYNVFKHKKQK